MTGTAAAANFRVYVSQPSATPSRTELLKITEIGNMSWPQCSRVEARQNAATSCANATTTDIVFQVQDKDTRIEYDNTTGIFTATEAGSYSVSWSVASASAAWAALEYWITYLSKNNSIAAGSGYQGSDSVAWAAQTFRHLSRGSAIVYLAASDTLRIKVYHNQGAAVNTNGDGISNYFHIHKVS
jgi:hypothetical protein